MIWCVTQGRQEGWSVRKVSFLMVCLGTVSLAPLPLGWSVALASCRAEWSVPPSLTETDYFLSRTNTEHWDWFNSAHQTQYRECSRHREISLYNSISLTPLLALLQTTVYWPLLKLYKNTSCKYINTSSHQWLLLWPVRRWISSTRDN